VKTAGEIHAINAILKAEQAKLAVNMDDD